MRVLEYCLGVGIAILTLFQLVEFQDSMNCIQQKKRIHFEDQTVKLLDQKSLIPNLNFKRCSKHQIKFQNLILQGKL